MKITAVTPAELDRLGDEYTARVVAAVRRVLRGTVDRANGHYSLAQLAVIPTLWAVEVDAGLAHWLARSYWTGVDAVFTPLLHALTASAADEAADPTPERIIQEAIDAGLSRVSTSLAERHLAGARNRLVGISDDIWAAVRDELIAGMDAGEGTETLASRITGTGGLVRPRVEVIARTEVNRAVNAGAIAQARAAGVQTKTWVAVGDARTRPEHLDADGQTVGVDELFDVGGESLDAPGDGSPGMSINCRCTCSYEINDEQLSAPEEEAMTADAHDLDCGCDELTAAGEHFGASKSVSSKPWDGSPGNFTDEQYQNSAAACDPASTGTVKQRCFLPHHDPGGALNRAGLGAAAGRVSALAGRNPQAAARAKAHLRSHYNQLGEDVPDTLKAADEDTEALATPPGLKPCPPGMKPDGNGGCMKAAATVEDQVQAAIEHTDTDIVFGGKPNPGTKKDKRLHENNPPKPKASSRLTEALADAPAPDMAPQWRGPLLVEGRETGDRREFAKGAITWPDPSEVPLILQWQKETGHGSDHDVTVAVGRVDRIWKDGDLVVGEGRYDIHPDAVEYQRRVEAGFAGGISVNADDIADADVEAVYDTPDGEEEEGDLFSMLFARPTKVIYHAGRLRGATGCDIPAFIESKITAVDSAAEPLAAPQRVAATHETDTSPDEWDGEAQLARLRMVNSRAVAAEAFAWIGATGEQVPLAECWGLHHEIGPSGDPQAANLTACLQAIMVLHDSPVPMEDREQVHRHLASHLYDAGIRPPVYEPEQALLAHAWQDELWHPPRAWFADPKLTVPTPIIVTDAGQIFGLATEWNTCHIGYANKCVPPPRETYHDRFMTGTVTCDDGTEVPVGQITAGIGHASTEYGVSAVQAAEHYDNTSAVVADVAVGNCRLGIWVAGAVRPWAEAQRVQSLKASGQVSPDWRRIGGQMRLVGLLTVNVSGFQVDGAVLSRPRLRTVYREGKLEAMIASGFSSVHMGPPPVDPAQQKKDELLRLREMLRAEIHGERVS